MTRDRLVDHWDANAARYDAAVAPVERVFLGAARRWVCARITGESLEVAVGTGMNLPLYPAGGVITGVEWSPAMLDLAREKAAVLGREADLRVGDAQELPFDDASFDTVLCTYSLCCIPDHRAALTEAARVLRPGGRLLLADHVLSTSWPVRLAQRAADVVGVPVQGEYFTRRPLPIVQELGLEVVDSHREHAGAIERLDARKPV